MYEVKIVATSITTLPKEEVTYTEYEIGIPRNRFKIKTPHHQFDFKVIGERYVNGEFVSDWVQYL